MKFMYLQIKRKQLKIAIFFAVWVLVLSLFACHQMKPQAEIMTENSVQTGSFAESGVQVETLVDSGTQAETFAESIEETPRFYLSFLHHLSLEKHSSFQKESENSLLWTLEDGSLIKVETELAYRSELLSYAKRKNLFAGEAFLSDLENKDKNIQVLMKEYNQKLLELQLRQSLLLPFQNIENAFSNATFLLEENTFPILSYRSNLEGKYTLSGAFFEKDSFLLMQIAVADDLCDMENGDELYFLKFSLENKTLSKEQTQDFLYKAFQTFMEKIENGAFMKKSCAL